jgi:small multidrug resistance family-3 protein
VLPHARLPGVPDVKTVSFFILAAAAEIGGCFMFWAWLRLKQSPLWAIPGLLALAVFAVALTRIDSAHAGRTFAAYGGVYIAASLSWLWLVERVRPDRWDLLGAAICLAGAAVILLGPRTAGVEHD